MVEATAELKEKNTATILVQALMVYLHVETIKKFQETLIGMDWVLDIHLELKFCISSSNVLF